MDPPSKVSAIISPFYEEKNKLKKLKKTHNADKWSKQNFNSDLSCSKSTLKTVCYLLLGEGKLPVLVPLLGVRYYVGGLACYSFFTIALPE